MGKKEKLLHVAIILVSGAVAYMNAALAGILGLDDVGLFSGLFSSDFTVSRLLSAGKGGYFRPLAYLSYAFDAYAAGMDPGWFHLVNVALHLMNGILVYSLMSKLVEEAENQGYLALTAGLLFVLHPINTEAVMWISARSDLLCTFFTLAALLLLQQVREHRRFFPLVCLFFAYLLSLFSKEASVILLAVVPCYLLCDESAKDFKQFTILTAPFIIAAVIYFLLRGGENAVVDPSIAKAVKSVIAPIQRTHQSVVVDLFAVYGFYLKKLVYPFPLNFAIVSIDKPLALFSCLLAVPLAAILYFRWRLSRLPILLVVFGTALPVIAFTTKLPWTPYAERYLYLPMVGFSMLATLLVFKISRLPKIVPVALVLLLAIPTVNRVSLWTYPVAFWTDVVAQSPEFPRGYIGLAAAQIDAHDYEAAEKNLDRARAAGIDKAPLWNLYASAALARKDYPRYEAAMSKLASLSPNPVEVYIRLIENLLKIPESDMPRREVYDKAIGYHMKILAISPSFNLSYYNLGKLYWVMGDDRNAAHYLRLFVEKAKNDPMTYYARKMLDKIRLSTASESRRSTPGQNI